MIVLYIKSYCIILYYVITFYEFFGVEQNYLVIVNCVFFCFLNRRMSHHEQKLVCSGF